MRHSLLLVAVLLVVALAGWAGSSTEKSELEMIRGEAQDGEIGAELLYGLALLEGRYGLQPDQQAGMLWIRKAADGGDPFACLTLGVSYSEGRGVAKDPAQAVGWWRKAAQSGNMQAEYLLGRAYLEGKGVSRDETEAARHLELAAKAGNTDAQYLLGKMYHEGYAVVQDQGLAKDWLERAAEDGHSEAINLLALVNRLYKSISLVSQESYSALEEKAEQGDPHAQYELGLRYESGALDVLADSTKAMMWLTRAAENGNILAMHHLARIYDKGLLGMKPDPAKADYWRKKSAGKHS